MKRAVGVSRGLRMSIYGTVCSLDYGAAACAQTRASSCVRRGYYNVFGCCSQILATSHNESCPEISCDVLFLVVLGITVLRADFNGLQLDST